MKRIVPILLAALMVLTMCVTAVAYVVPNPPVANTTDIFDREVLNLNAAKGTPTVDGTKDDIWKNAVTYVGNKGTANIMNAVTKVTGGSTITTSGNIQISLMWDENNLYILEERFDETYDTDKSNTDDVNGRNTWTGGDKTMYNIIVPTTMTEDGGASSFQLVTEVTQALVDIDADGVKTLKAVGTTAPAVCWVRENNYNSFIPSLEGKPYVYDYKADADLAGFGGFVQLTETGYQLESVIPWSLLDHDNTDEYVPTLGNEFGIKIYPNYGTDTGTKVYHINHDIGSGFADYCGYGQVTLINSISEYITPETAWYTDNMEATSYDIDTAAKLLGLVYLTHSYSKFGITPAELPALPENPTDTQKENYEKAKAEAELEAALRVTKGKTFNITADIELNPGYTGAEYTVPGNIWFGLKNFAGTLNGNNKTISGLYNDATTGWDFTDEMALINNLTAEGVVKDLTLKGTFVADAETDILGAIAVQADGATVTNVTTTELVLTPYAPPAPPVEDESESESTPAESESTPAESESTPAESESTPAESETDEKGTEKGTEKATDDKKTDDKKNEGGCASVAGGIVVAILALAAVPAVCLKKKD